MSRIVAVIATIGIVTAGLVAVDLAVSSPPTAVAASGNDFKPGNIISDAVFFNASTMSTTDIQRFLESKVPQCRTGYTCLINYKQNTPNKAKDPMCAAYSGAKNESAATIIYKVAQACGVNPQVILTTLQKEQGFITDDWPSSRMYRSAMGYGCPDTADCDVNYYGFFNQVYTGAWAFQRYTMPLGTGPGTEWYSVYRQYAPGKRVNIRYHPNGSCGTKSVLVENEATSSLYTYTPYTPNARALSVESGYGAGDACSAYGNRNFFYYFTDWFGSTQGYAPDSRLKALYDRIGGSSGLLGYPVSSTVISYPNGGIGQQFQKGWGWWSKASGAYRTSGGIGNSYVKSGGPNGPLGYPIGDMTTPTSGGYAQAFQNGGIYWTSSTGTRESLGAINTAYQALGGPTGRLGYPLASSQSESGGTSQGFQNATMYWSAKTGGISVPNNALGVYAAAGGPGGQLGYPIAEATTDGKKVSRLVFERGSISWTGSGTPTIDVSVSADVNRVFGDDRYWTAVAISKDGYPKTAPIVYVATGTDFPDALSASAAAAHKGGPLLLTLPNRLPDVVKNEIKRLNPKRIVVVGSSAAVSDVVLRDLQKLAAETTRLGGRDRFETSQLIISDAFVQSDIAYVATGMDFPDALSASAAAGAVDAPMVLVKGTKNTLTATTTDLLTKLGVNRAIIAGSDAVVSLAIEKSLAARMPTSRLAGKDRYETSRLINKVAFPRTARVFLATGATFPDALAGAAVAGAIGSPVYIVKNNCLETTTLTDIQSSGASIIALLGSAGVLGQGVANLNRCR